MKPVATILFLLPLFLCFCSFPILTLADEATSTNTTLVVQLCKQTNNSEFCISSFSNVPDIGQANLTGVALFALRVASKNGSDTASLIKTILSDASKLEPGMQQILADCSDHYLDAVDQLDDSVAALLANAFKDVQAWVSAAITDANTCQDGLKNYTGAMESDLSNRVTVFLQLCSNALAFVNRLAQAQQ